MKPRSVPQILLLLCLFWIISGLAQPEKLRAQPVEGWDDRFGTLGLNGPVYALAVNGREVYAGGYFTTAGAVSANNVARWDGSNWHALGDGITGAGGTAIVYALAITAEGHLYAAGQFAMAGGASANNVAVWNGNDWARLGNSGARGTNSTVYALATKENEVFAGGIFTMAGDVIANGVAKWNGAQWSRLGTTLANGVTGGGAYALSVDADALFVGGDFANAGPLASVHNVAQWNVSTATWSALDRGTNGKVQSLAGNYFGDLVVGGIFSLAVNVRANNLARWNGNVWASLGTREANGVTGEVRALAAGMDYLYVGGNFYEAGGQPVQNIVRWDRNSWSALGSGVNGVVHALAHDGRGAVFVGGQFSSAGGMVSNNFGIWQEGTNAVEEKGAPGKTPTLVLHANYPNPFNPATTIHYALPRAQFVRVQIFDAAGREVAVLAQGWQAAGEHRVPFHAGNLGAGIYLCRLTAGEREHTRKMLLLR